MTTQADTPGPAGGGHRPGPLGGGHRPGPLGGATDPEVLLRELTPTLHPTPVVYTVSDELPTGCNIFATIREPEGLTLVLELAEAEWLGMAYDYVAAIITLTVHSSLEAVGLTAAVSRALTAAGISCNVIAGAFHDHLLVPWDRREDALAALRELQGLHGQPPRPTT